MEPEDQDILAALTDAEATDAALRRCDLASVAQHIRRGPGRRTSIVRETDAAGRPTGFRLTFERPKVGNYPHLLSTCELTADRGHLLARWSHRRPAAFEPV